MGVIDPKFKNNVIRKRFAIFEQRLKKVIIFYLSALGESLVAYARENHSYIDQTGNLTNSIGYAVVYNKEIVKSSEAASPDVSDAISDTINKLLKEVSNTYELIIVAGMNYAAYVESKGYNVILPAELKARTDFPKRMKEIEELANKKVQEFLKISA